jgi:hypothetical protein
VVMKRPAPKSTTIQKRRPRRAVKPRRPTFHTHGFGHSVMSAQTSGEVLAEKR